MSSPIERGHAANALGWQLGRAPHGHVVVMRGVPSELVPRLPPHTFFECSLVRARWFLWRTSGIDDASDNELDALIADFVATKALISVLETCPSPKLHPR
jgi:hypothetical protein